MRELGANDFGPPLPPLHFALFVVFLSTRKRNNNKKEKSRNQARNKNSIKKKL